MPRPPRPEPYTKQSVRIPDRLRDQMRVRAERTGTDMTAVMVEAIEQGLSVLNLTENGIPTVIRGAEQ